MPQIISEERKAYNRAYYQLNKNKSNKKCEHNKRKSSCKDCGGSQICEHNRLKSSCKDCGGSQICEHNRIKSRCKECGGASICEHNRQKYCCKDCGGSEICEHNKRKSRCKECGGSQICEHNRIKSQCKECGGISICEHNRIKSKCKECGGGSFCEHNKIKSRCKECGGGEICEHQRRKSSCKDCNPINYLVSLQRSSIRRMLLYKNLTKIKPTIEYLGCSAEYLLEYLQKKMIEGMTFNNIHIDHIKPVSRFNLQNEDDFLDCCHYTNLQPLLAEDNLVKHNKWNDTNEEFWRTNIKGKEYLQIYNSLD